MRRRLLSVLLPAFLGAATASPDVPTGYQDSVVAENLPNAIALAFTPDGRLLISRQNGQLHVYENGALLPGLAMTVGTCGASERGFLGIAVDPDFATNNFIYVYYSASGFPCENRVSRLTLPESNVIDPLSEVILLDNIPAPGWIHNAGDLHFGKDGYLYVSVGDGGCDLDNDTICGGANNNARERHTLLGKILRITKQGGIPPDNPFLGAGTQRCQFGNGTPGLICQETYAWGFRNPFRFAMDPVAPGVRFFVNDVGQNGREEINLGQRGADYGWNCFEGTSINSTTGLCSPTPPNLVSPLFEYSHLTGCTAVTGGAFLPTGSWPTALNGSYFYGDYVCGKIFRLAQVGTSWVSTEFATNLGGGGPVSLRFGPRGNGLGLYYTTFANGGQVRVIEFVGTGNRSPVAVIAANPTVGTVPLAVTFDGSASSDPDGDPLTYVWNFGDGSPPLETTSPITVHNYLASGSFTAVLRAKDDQDALSDPVSILIAVGNSAPSVSINVPVLGALFRVGENVVLNGTATDPEDGPLPAANLTWNVRRHHDTHFHPWVTDAVGNNIPMTTPNPEDLAAAQTSYLEVLLTARDSRGATTTVSRIFNPRKVDVSLQTTPSGLTLVVNGVPVVAPTVITSWDNYALALQAPDQQLAGTTYNFLAWSDGGARNHTFITPPSAVTLSASFTVSVPVPQPVAFLVVTSRDRANRVQWVNPSAPGFVSTTLVFRTDDRCPNTPADGTVLPTTGAAGGPGVVDHTGLVNGTIYHYAAFANFSGGGVSARRCTKGRPFDTSGGAKWAYSTGFSALTAPSIGSPAVLVMSNDRMIHAIGRGASGGEPTAGFSGPILPGVVQARVPIVPGNLASGHANLAFLAGQDGVVYAVDADTGAIVWQSPLAQSFQGAVAGGFTAFGFPFNRLFVGTRNSTGGNSFLGLDPATGAPVGAPYAGTEGGGVGPVNAGATVDYATRRVYFTSRAAAGGAHTVWCLEATAGGFSYAWSAAVGGGVDTAPVIRGDRVYVGGLDGLIYALDKATGVQRWSFPAGGVANGFLFPDRFGTGLYFATANRVVGISDDGSAASALFPPISVIAPSFVLFRNAEGGQPARLYYGSVVGARSRIVELDLSQSPPTQRFVELGGTAAAIGAPTYDNALGMIYVGSEEGVFYGVTVPLTPN